MSYDIWLSMDTGNGHEPSVFDVGNYTSNVSEMWFKALGGVLLSSLDGKNAGECVELLRKANQYMEEHYQELLDINPPNGWGNYEGALEYIQKLKRGCIEHPKAIIRISV